MMAWLRAALFAPLLAAALAGAALAHPWDDAKALSDQTAADFQHGGFAAIAPHVPALEAALAQAGDPVQKSFTEDGTTYVLSENTSDGLMGMMSQVAAQKEAGHSGNVVAVRDPYPGLSLLLGAYYNEFHHPEDAIRVLDIGLSADPADPALVTEKGAALVSMKRWPEVLKQYSDGLDIPDLAARDKARMLRGEGVALTEMGRLDESEAAYKASLQLDPGNGVALNELAYIAQLRAGGPKTPTELTAPNKPH